MIFYEKKVDVVSQAIARLEQKDTKTTFYSASKYPEVISTNVKFSPLSSEQLSLDESEARSISFSTQACFRSRPSLVGNISSPTSLCRWTRMSSSITDNISSRSTRAISAFVFISSYTTFRFLLSSRIQ